MRGFAVPVAILVAQVGPAVARAERLVDVSLVARGGYVAPRFDPTGDALAASGPGHAGLYLLDLATGAARRVTDEPAAGVHARFLSDGRLAFRVRRAGADRALVVDRAGREAALVEPTPLAEVRDDRLFVRGPAGVAREVGGGDRYFAPRPSPDGRRIAVEALATGIWIYDRATDRLTHVGRGTAPAWSPDGAALAFERTEDDGHDLVASELVLYRVADRRVVALTATPDRLERRPSWSPDGRRIAFDDGRGAVFVATLSGGAP